MNDMIDRADFADKIAKGFAEVFRLYGETFFLVQGEQFIHFAPGNLVGAFVYDHGFLLQKKLTVAFTF